MTIRTIILGVLAASALLAVPLVPAEAQQATSERQRAASARPAERLVSTTSLRSELRAELAQRRATAAMPAAQPASARR